MSFLELMNRQSEDALALPLKRNLATVVFTTGKEKARQLWTEGDDLFKQVDGVTTIATTCGWPIFSNE